MEKKENIRLAVIAHHPVQYHAPLYRELHALEGVDVNVIYLDTVGIDGTVDKEFGQPMKWDMPLLGGYCHEFLPNYSFSRIRGFFSRINPALFSKRWTSDVDAVLIQGYSIFSNWIALLICRRRKIKILWRGEAVIRESDRSRSLRSLVKRMLLRLFFGRCDAFMYTCAGNKNYLRFFGVPEHKMFPLPCAVDNEFFRAEFERNHPNRDHARARLGISKQDIVVVFCARFTARKRAADIIHAVARLRRNEDITLLFVGDGPEMTSLEALVTDKDIQAVFVGFKNQSELAEFYSIADVAAVISSYDPSPKAMNEMMNFALPIIATDVVGTAEDLVRDGVSGFVVPVGDICAISEAIEFLREDPERRREMGQESGKIVATFTMKSGADGVLEALRSVMHS